MKKILLAIIDDSLTWADDTIDYLTVSLDKLGYELVAELFENTIDFKAQWDAGYRPHAIKCDMRIPEDLDGPENLYLYLKSLNEEQRMFFATANLSEHDSEVIARTKAEFIIKDQVTYPSFVQKLIAMATMPTVKNIEIETEKPGLNPNQLEEKLQAKLREYTEELGLQLISIMLIESESYDSGTNIYHFLAVFK